MSHVAYLLNNEGSRTKRGKRWNARAVKDVVTNRLYIGEYDVAGADFHIEEYRIIDDETFNTAQKLRTRFTSEKSERPPMLLDRKLERIEKIISKYYETIRKYNITLNFMEESLNAK
jgi:predicted nucleotidyltransferase component of viral defense system